LSSATFGSSKLPRFLIATWGDLRESLQQQGSVCAAVTAGRERIGGNQVAAALFGLCVPKT